MQKYGLSKKPKKDAKICRTIGVSFHKKWNIKPFKFLQDCNWDTSLVLERLTNDKHFYSGR
ncbi:MAG: hypothetical protein N2517_07650 [Ignavibacteria bacterium]|nr:hypothetical protein [Ignavibacteria bacterium]